MTGPLGLLSAILVCCARLQLIHVCHRSTKVLKFAEVVRGKEARKRLAGASCAMCNDVCVSGEAMRV